MTMCVGLESRRKKLFRNTTPYGIMYSLYTLPHGNVLGGTNWRITIFWVTTHYEIVYSLYTPRHYNVLTLQCPINIFIKVDS